MTLKLYKTCKSTRCACIGSVQIATLHAMKGLCLIESERMDWFG
uniref:Uncharacterized protein n=1 Tax=Anguilla anguilla TaxID=7936 RepID=A0A0E9T9W2_ANGAN